MKTKFIQGTYLIVLFVVYTSFTNSCKKDDDDTTKYNNKTIVYGSMTDQDNISYKTITIGTQTWMAENLKTTKYRNGDLIETTSPSTLDLGLADSPKYQWAYDSIEANATTYGRLYTWYAVNDSRNICPMGWHIPSDEEWTTLITYLGGESVAGAKLNEAGSAHWLSSNIYSDNSSGFTALPGGYRTHNGNFIAIGYSAQWWSSTELNNALHAYWYSIINTIKGDGRCYENYVNRNDYYKSTGLSVRCIKD